MKRVLLLGLVALVAVVVAGAATFAYVLTQPQPVRLTVANGSTVGVIEGDFVNYPWTNSTIVHYFNGTTYANQSGDPSSALTLRLKTSTYYAGADYLVITDIFATVQGTFASGLHLSGLTLTVNQTGRGNAWGAAEPVQGPNPTNISYDPANRQMINLGPGVNAFTPTLANQTGKSPFYEFAFPAYIQDEDPIGYNQFLGLRATLTGPFTPAVSVGILLQIIDTPGGAWG